jgi:hypothetical protein
MPDLALVTAGWARFVADPAAWVMLLGLVFSGRHCLDQETALLIDQSSRRAGCGPG